jgi:Tfp pilus assembly protein FimT
MVSTPKRRRSGMTLLEILLTLCLLVILASITWPGLGRPMATQRLRESADQVRMEWVRTRVDAMSSGQLYVFRYSPDGNTYAVEVQATEDGVSDTTQASPSGTVGSSPSVAGEGLDQATGLGSAQRRLADKVRFVSDQTAGQSSPPSTTPDAQSPAAADFSLSPPIYFYPDGTCSDARVRLTNEYNQTIDLLLRGLTGVVQVSAVQSGDASAAPSAAGSGQ